MNLTDLSVNLVFLSLKLPNYRFLSKFCYKRAQLLNKSSNRKHSPFRLDILNVGEQTLATIKRGWTLFMSEVKIFDSDGNTIAYINQKFKIMKPTFTIYNSDERFLYSITGDWKAWNFTITNDYDDQIGTITKKWTGILREILTTADKYIVSINPGEDVNENKIALVATAVAIDMILKESKNHGVLRINNQN